MQPQAVDREEAEDSFRPGQAPGGDACHPLSLQDPLPAVLQQAPGFLPQTRLGVDRSSPAQPERVGGGGRGEGKPAADGSPLLRAGPPGRLTHPALQLLHPGAGRPLIHPAPLPAPAATRGRWRPPRGYLHRAQRTKGALGTLASFTCGHLLPRLRAPSAKPASGPREGVNFCSTLLLEIC